MSTRITIRDVAERAGCGVASVSRVLNNSGPASEAVRERVLAAAKDLGFEFNELGRSLQSRRSRTLAVLVPSLRNDVFAMAIEGVQREANAAGYQILLACVNYGEDSEIEAVRTLVAKGVDGAILTVANPNDSMALDYLDSHAIPYCLMFNQPDRAVPSVGVDNVAAAALVADALRKQGHETVGFVALNFRASERSRMRFEGLRTALLAQGAPEPMVVEVAGTQDDLDNRIGEMLASDPGITAIFASNDLVALACIRALRRRHRSVPDDISIVGFDGIDAGELVEPTLATIVTPNAEMGRRAAASVIAAITEGRPVVPRQVHLPFHFRSGASLGRRRVGIDVPADPGRRDTSPFEPQPATRKLTQ